tara:strand:- start:129 stop:434 length:306 start_codon:yes stop_codon:yes gene_type:complete
VLNSGHQLQLKKLKQKVLEVFPEATFKLLPKKNRTYTSPSENSHHASIQELEKKLSTIKTIDELKGFANRRSIFKLDVPKWNENEKKAIQWRKIEIERGTR